jgi:hypothetical protein
MSVVNFNAEKLGRYICEKCVDGATYETFETEEIARDCGVDINALMALVAQLERQGLILVNHSASASPAFNPTPALFARFDPSVKADADQVLAILDEAGALCSDLQARLNWIPRRLNPACEYLVAGGRAEGTDSASPPLAHAHLRPTARISRSSLGRR